jgi:hypothetical protein
VGVWLGAGVVGIGLAVAVLEAVALGIGDGDGAIVSGEMFERPGVPERTMKEVPAAGDEDSPGAGASVQAPSQKAIPSRKAVIHRPFTENP